jgi:hypothetical protein
VGTNLTATASSAVANSINHAQEAGQEHWINATPSIEMSAVNRVDVATVSGLTLVTEDADLLTATSISLWDDSDTVKTFTAAENSPPTMASGSGNFVSTWDSQTFAAYLPNWMSGLDKPIQNMRTTPDGRHLCVTHNLYYGTQFSIVKLDIPHNGMGSGTVLSTVDSSTLPAPTSGTTPVYNGAYGGSFMINNAGTRIWTKTSSMYAFDTTYHWLRELDLDTSYDLSSGSGGYGQLPPRQSSSYDEEDLTSNVVLNPDEDQILVTTGDDYDAAAYMDVYQLSSGSLNGATHNVEESDGIRVYAGFQLSPDGANLIRSVRNDDGSSWYQNQILELGAAGDLTSSYTTVKTNSMRLTGSSYRQSWYYDAFDGIFYEFQYTESTSYYKADIVDDESFTLLLPPSTSTLSGDTVSGTVDWIGLSDLSVPVLKLDAALTEGAVDAAGATASVASSDPGWSFDGTTLVRDIDYSQQAVYGDNLQYQISGIDQDTIIENITIDLTRG